MGDLGLLFELGIWDTNIGGPLPTEIGQLTNLVTLFLENNAFTGTVPLEYGSLTNLELVIFKLNYLTGSIDQFCEAERAAVYFDCQLTCSCCVKTCESF
jgi:hypothetical protein